MKQGNEMRRLIYTIVVFAGLIASATAQEAGYFSHYYLNPVILNPGATGFENSHEFIFDYRNKSAGFDGSPRTFTLLYNGPVGDRIGVGGQLLTDRIGEYRTFKGAANFAYKFSSDMWQFGAGIQAGFVQTRLDNLTDDPFIDDTDDVLNDALDGTTSFDASVGFHAEYDSAAYFGISFPDLIRTRLTSISSDFEDPNEEFNFVFYGGYRFYIDEHDFFVEPSLAVKNMRRIPFHVDINLKLTFLDEQLVGGITYSVGEVSNFGLLLGTRIGGLRLYYSYDIGFGDFQEFNNGSHEITAHYLLARKSK